MAQIQKHSLQALSIDDFRKDLDSRVKVKLIGKVLQSAELDESSRVDFGIQLYYYLFVSQITQIQQKYPSEHRQDSELFWSGYRRFPTTLDYDITDESFVNFVGSCANLLAIIFNKQDQLNLDKLTVD